MGACGRVKWKNRKSSGDNRLSSWVVTIEGDRVRSPMIPAGGRQEDEQACLCPVSPLEEKCFCAWGKVQASVHMCGCGSR